MNHLGLRAAMLWYGARFWRPVARMTTQPAVAQLETLRRIIRLNRETLFGTRYGFGDISDVAGFLQRVPVSDYEALRPYVEEQRLTGRPALTSEPPLFYAQTSGSTAAPKHIPVTATALAQHRREQALFSYLQFRACPAAFDGMGLGIMGAAVEGHLDSGHAVGSVSGRLYESLPAPLRARFVIPPAVATIPDYQVKYRVVLALALAEAGITYLGTPNPSTLLRLMSMLNAERDCLLDVVATGNIDAIEGVPPDVRAGLHLRANRARAAVLSHESELTYANVWPRLRLVTTWTGGSCGVALESVRRQLPSGAAIMELGYQATEVRGTLPLNPGTAAGLPALHHHFFEFAEQDAWDAGDRTCLTLEQLEDGRHYYVIVTTAAGLYRYFMNDLLCVTGRLHDTPLLQFVQKGRGVTSLTGEKLYETQAIAAVQEGARQLGFEPAFFLVVASESRNGYELFIELEASVDRRVLADRVDVRLGEMNLEYHAKRQSGRLEPLRVTLLRRGAADAHKAAAVRAGQREAQYKPVVLQYQKDLRWQIAEYAQP